MTPDSKDWVGAPVEPPPLDPGHRLDACHDVAVALSDTDRVRCCYHGLHRAPAEPVDRHPRHRVRETCEQGGHPADVVALLPLGIGTTDDHVVHLGRVKVESPNDLLDALCDHGVRPDPR